MKKQYVSADHSRWHPVSRVVALVWVFLWFCVDAPAATWESWSYQRNGDGIYIYDYAGYEFSVTVPKSIEGVPVTAISSRTFFWRRITNVSLPESVTSVGEVPFEGCESLTSIQVAPANSVFTSRDGVLFNKDQTTLIRYPRGRDGFYRVPAGVWIIAERAFAECTRLAEVVIPDTVWAIGERAFQHSAVQKVVVGRGVRLVGDGAFDTTYLECSSPCYGGGKLYGGAIEVYFLGSPPQADAPYRENYYVRIDNSVAPRTFYWVGANGWSNVFGGFPTTPWSGLPAISRQPNPAAAFAGATLQLSVEAFGAETLSFDWQHREQHLPGGIGSNLTLTNVQATEDGPYRVVVGNALGSVTSEVAAVTVRLPVAGSYEAAAVALGPLGYWPLDETHGTEAVDYASDTRAETVGEVEFGLPGATANTGTAFGLNGSHLRVHSSAASDLGTSDFTLLAWIYPTAFTQSGIVAKGSYGSGRGWLLDFNAAGEGTLRLETSLGFPGGQGTIQTAPGVVALNEWQHVAVSCRRDPGAGPGLDTTGNGWTRIYRNGKLVQSGDIGAGDLSNPDLPLTIGSSYGNFYGRIDEVALFGKALSGEQIAALYAAGIGRSPPLQISRSDSGITLAWPEGTLQSATSLDAAGTQANWADVPSAASPYTVEPTNAAALYRVRKP